ncbi:hypothetical protein [Faecalibacterium prausnitzii]|uniref:hypothetical protein n=1 Tax=Faecalibacterium prausnitzii TaxID=853 RepID=UPI001FAB1373|nr:hypothetical protein [Faecalibacterium prausnitzii]
MKQSQLPVKAGKTPFTLWRNQPMKMLKKLLAVVLTGAMALTLLTACGGKAVRDKDIADALNDMAKGSLATYTFKSRTDEQAMAKAIAALSESDRHTTGGKASEKVMKILKLDEGGANEESRFVWWGAVFADEIGTAGQAYNVMDKILSQKAVNAGKLTGKKPGDIRYIGTALSTTTYFGGKQKTVRIIVVTAEAEPVDKK